MEIKLCPYRTITIKKTVEEGTKVSTQQFMPCICKECIGYDATTDTCVRTHQKCTEEE